jgi:branched-subunit amino acid transport protein
MEMRQESKEIILSTYRQALYLWVGLSLSLTLFFVQSQIVFIKASPLPTSKLEWIILVIGIVTFIFGLLFFKNYLSLRRNKILKMPFSERKQNILMAYVLQFILFETLGLYGVLISVLSQNTLKAVPFVVFAYLGFVLAFPKKEKINPYFQS